MFKAFNEFNKCITREDVFNLTGFNPINLEFSLKKFT